MFVGPSDGAQTRVSFLSSSIIARSVRIIPTGGNKKINDAIMRAEIFGCVYETHDPYDGRKTNSNSNDFLL